MKRKKNETQDTLSTFGVINSGAYKIQDNRHSFFNEEIMATADKNASSEINVVIIGETGTGRHGNRVDILCRSRDNVVFRQIFSYRSGWQQQ